MGFLDFLRAKRQTTPAKYEEASLAMLERDRAKSPPFSARAATSTYSSWIYAAATLNAQAVASVPLRLYVRSRPGMKSLFPTRPVPRARKRYLRGELQSHPSGRVQRKALAGEFEEVATDHPVLEVLRKANSVDDGFGLAVTRILYLELCGNAYLHPVYDATLGVPVELWTMPAQWVKVVPSVDGLISHYTYGAEPTITQDFQPDEVIHFKRPNPRSLLYGMGKVEAAWNVVQQNIAAHEMDLSFFENSNRPDWVAIVKGGAGREQLERFETKMREMLQGTRKSGKMVAITGDIDMKPLNFPTKDMMGREEIVEEIAAVFGVPASMLKANDPNLASAKAGYAQWRESTIAPICRLDEETLNAKLLPLFGIEDDAYLAYDNPVPQDRQQDLQELQIAVTTGWMTPNEARVESGYEPLPDPAADQLRLQPSAPASPFGGFGLPAPGQQRQQPPALPEAQGEVDAEPQQASKRLLLPGRKATKQDDCVSDKIRTLMDEGYPQDQAIAIAISMCEGKTWSQSDPVKAVGDVDTRPTEEMARLAARGLELRSEYGRGGTEVGVARARDISNRANLSPETVARMASFFARHQVDLDAEGARPGEQGYPTAGAIAWMLWGGDPSDPEGAGAGWAARKVEELGRAREKRFARDIVLPAVEEMDRYGRSADDAAMDRLMAAVDKSFAAELMQDDELVRYALDGAMGEVEMDIDRVMKAYGLDSDTDVSSTILKGHKDNA